MMTADAVRAAREAAAGAGSGGAAAGTVVQAFPMPRLPGHEGTGVLAGAGA
jgi:hypothetical protein